MEEIKNPDNVDKVLNQKLDDIIEDSKLKTAALKKILKGLDDLDGKKKGDKK